MHCSKRQRRHLLSNPNPPDTKQHQPYEPSSLARLKGTSLYTSAQCMQSEQRKLTKCVYYRTLYYRSLCAIRTTVTDSIQTTILTVFCVQFLLHDIQPRGSVCKDLHGSNQVTSRIQIGYSQRSWTTHTILHQAYQL